MCKVPTYKEAKLSVPSYDDLTLMMATMNQEE